MITQADTGNHVLRMEIITTEPVFEGPRLYCEFRYFVDGERITEAEFDEVIDAELRRQGKDPERYPKSWRERVRDR